MGTTADSTSLTGKLLIAMPGMGDPRFEKSVIYLCAHSKEGSMGLIVNKPVADLSLDELLDQLGIPAGDGSQGILVHYGGPVERGRGFVLHSSDYHADDATLAVDANFAMTATQEVLQAIAQGNGPRTSRMMLGYAGWGPGQLEDEIVHNGWLVTDATAELVFATDPHVIWASALQSIGVDPVSLSSSGGRA